MPVGCGRPRVYKFPVHEVMQDLRSIRVKNNISQEKLADAIGVDLTSIKNWENGRKNPTLAHITKYAARFNYVIMVVKDD